MTGSDRGPVAHVDGDLVALGTEVLRPVEFDRCTAHRERIAEMTSYCLNDGRRIVLDPPIVVHLTDDNKLYGTLVGSSCDGQYPR